MHIQQEKDNDRCGLQVAGELTLHNAVEFKAALLAALADCEELEIDLAEVSDMDSAGFQVLVLVKREALAQNKQCSLHSHSQVVIDVLDIYHMAAYFGDPVVLSGNEN
ncbi:MAG: STAS domain-containing protein [Gammaproteobacteria bacterium]|nr:STAS domain-containing protein [Gammaproteobacteria bacterium]